MTEFISEGRKDYPEPREIRYRYIARNTTFIAHKKPFHLPSHWRNIETIIRHYSDLLPGLK